MRGLPNLLLLASVLAGPCASAAPEFDDGRLPFTVEAGGERTNLRVLAWSVLPGERMDIAVVDAEGAWTLDMSAGTAEQTGRSARWRWRAPEEPGLARLRLRPETPPADCPYECTMTLVVFVLVPADRVRNERLEGYRIGRYPERPLRGEPSYLPPPGFVRVRREDVDVEVSPHHRLGDFLCKQQAQWPRFLVLRTRLLLKLEYVLGALNDAGVRSDALHVMSGYRTPFYNAAIGNVPYSRHVYGGAADVFVDEAPRDGVMDDLNGDGRLDRGDAAWFYEFVERLAERADWAPYVGGLGEYDHNAAHGAFVHLDVRGRRARWGR